MATHFTKPIRYARKGTAGSYANRGEMPIGIDPDFYGIVDDFVGVALDTTNDWTELKDVGASTGIAADEVGGVLNLSSTATTDNDGASVQGNEIFALTADKSIWFATRIQNNDADQTDVCVGLTLNFATNPEAMLTATDRIVFQIDDGDASILCKTEKDGTETSTDSGVDLADNTWSELAFNVEGTSKVHFYVDGKHVATHATNLPDDENLAAAAMSISGSATGTRVTKVDYIIAVQER